MTSIKCTNCGLVNFSTEQNCKRCKSPLPHSATTAKFQGIETPPPPPIFHDTGRLRENPGHESYPCIKCGSRGLTTVRNFVKVYHSPVAILGIFMGCLPYLLLKLLLRTKHNLTGPFCEKCWTLYQTGRTYSTLNVVLFVAVIFAGLAFAIYIDSLASEWWLLGSFVLGLIVLALGEKFVNSFGPKYKRVSSKEVVVDAPNVGEIVYTR